MSLVQPMILGGADFCRRMSAVIHQAHPRIKVLTGTIGEAWALMLSQRPNLLIIGIGYSHSPNVHSQLRKLLQQQRERFGNEIFNCICLHAPEQLAYGGDLLFAEEFTLEHSDYVDTFIAAPPGNMPSINTLGEQVLNTIYLCEKEFIRRAEGKPPIPPLASPGWVTTLADVGSRELWMKWLPRYASYTNENPIIIGETGTGKTNLAYALHALSGRKGEFVAITPRDFSSSELVQAELFGAVAGAYTGAVDKWGLVKKAEKGTLFIDELQSIDKDLQGKIITFIENKSYRRVGSSESITADVRFVFASNRGLYEMMANDILRDDFAYRLERVQLELLPLHRRRLDIVPAFAHALAKVKRQRPQALPVQGLSPEAFRIVFGQKWPGNLRQLENVVAQFCEICDMQEQNLISDKVVFEVFGSKPISMASSTSEVIANAAIRLSSEALSSGFDSAESGTERFGSLIRSCALEASGGDVLKAADLIQEHENILALASSQGLIEKLVH